MVLHALVTSYYMPEFDREGGSNRIFNLLEILRQFGWQITYIPQYDVSESRYTRLLQQLGIATYTSSEYYQQPERMISASQFDLAICHFWPVAEHWIPLIRKHSPQTKVVVDTVDLHFLRESRGTFYPNSANSGTRNLSEDYGSRMVRELNTYASADAVLTVSDKEANLLKDFFADSIPVYSISDGEEFPPSTLNFEQRKGLVFLSNFRHAPNVDAMQFLCQDIVPYFKTQILALDPIYIIGNGLSETIAVYAHGLSDIHLVGWVPSITPYLSRARVSIVPLRYGAGTKRKVIQSMLIGTPVVTTQVGAEGLDLVDGETALIADEPMAFAAASERLLNDRVLWEKIAVQGREHIMKRNGANFSKEQFKILLDSILLSHNK